MDREDGYIRCWIRSLVVLMALTSVPVYSQCLPKMILCITIDQLRQDYLQELEPLLSQSGINRIIHNGKVYNDVRFDYLTKNRASTLSSIFTGCYPSITGIDFPSKYDEKTLRQENIFLDNSVNGIYSKETLSPKAQQRATIGDVLKQEGAGYNIIYSVAAYSQTAIASGGYMANGVFWLNDNIASWATSSYYGEMPWYVSSYNKSSDSPNNRIMQSKDIWKIGDNRIINFLNKRGFDTSSFSYNYNSKNVSAYKMSRLANDEVTKLARMIISNAGYSDSNTRGLLAVTLDACPYKYNSNKNSISVELADKYLGIDRNISSILESVDKSVGLDNCLVTLSSTGYYVSNTKGLKPKNTELIFDTSKAKAIINMYLVALYGKGQWVTMLNDGELSLNERLIENKGIKLKDIEDETSRILKEMQGVDLVITSDDIYSGKALSPRNTLFANGIYNAKGVNIYWTLKEGYSTSNNIINNNVVDNIVATPAIFVIMGNSSRVENIPFDIHSFRDITKAIAWVMRIRPPNSIY